MRRWDPRREEGEGSLDQGTGSVFPWQPRQAGKASLDLQRGTHTHPAQLSVGPHWPWGGGLHVSAYFPAGATTKAVTVVPPKITVARGGPGSPHVGANEGWALVLSVVARPPLSLVYRACLLFSGRWRWQPPGPSVPRDAAMGLV